VAHVERFGRPFE